MNKNFLFTMIAAATLTGFTACSSDDSVENGGENDAKGNQFITINIQDVGTTPSTRADNGAGSGEGAGTKDNKYENGLDNENSITQVKFYFFDASGNAVNVNGATNANSKLITKTNEGWGGTYTGNGTTTTDPETVERRTQATLVLENYDGTLPTRMVAVVNPQNYSTTLDNNLSLSQLKALTTTTLGATTAANGSAAVANGYTDFAMTNSVYYGVTGETVDQNPTLEVSCENKFKTTSAGALADPVNIYVERIAAKVRAKVSTAEGNEWTTATIDGKTYPAYPVKDNNGVEQKYNEKQIYAVVYGWGLADEQGTAYDFKSLMRYDALNPSTTLGINHWTSGEFHRSFWEQIPQYSRVSHPWSYYTGRTFTEESNGTLSWTDKEGADANSMASDSKDAVYTLPNTDENTYSWDDVNRNTSATTPTKVVVAARLMYNNGTNETPDWQPVERCVSGTYTYVGLNDFKTFIANNSGIYVKKSGQNVYSTITADDIDFEAVTTDLDANRNYEVQAKLKVTANAVYGTGNVNEPTALTSDQVTTRLNSFKALIYREGLTYYYTTIQHLGTPGENNATKGTIGAYGVVRNHLYDVTINGMTGFGTPVYNPERGIVPETTEDQNSYLAVSINVLQWRVVSQSVNIDGTSK